jgi:hypothetical protein
MVVTQNMDGVRQAALELMVESLKAKDVERVLDNLRQQDADEVTLAKALPVRSLPDGYYDFASYILWLRSMRDSGSEMTIYADEAEGLRAIEEARQEFESKHPACPQCRTRQYSGTAIRCRNSGCGLEFKKRQ